MTHETVDAALNAWEATQREAARLDRQLAGMAAWGVDPALRVLRDVQQVEADRLFEELVDRLRTLPPEAQGRGWPHAGTC